MKILLLGEYSNVHWTLAQGLRQLGHEVTVVSNGDFWKDYPCDIRLARRDSGRLAGIRYLASVSRTIPQLRGFDVVQLINPMFLELKAERIGKWYRKLREQNGKVFLAAYGMDTYYIRACLETSTFEVSELAINGKFRDISDNQAAVADWINGAKRPLNEMIAQDCDGIIAGLWEYWKSYMQFLPDKTSYVPFPVDMPDTPAERYLEEPDGKVRFFLGIQKSRSRFKGTDILLDILKELESEFPDRCSLVTAENVPFAEYRRLMRSSDVLIDQLYSPTPNMNSLLAMSQGIAVAGGGELEPYNIIGEDTLHPVINLPPDREGIISALTGILDDPAALHQRKSDGMEYVRRHHDPVQVARRYLAQWGQTPPTGDRP